MALMAVAGCGGATPPAAAPDPTLTPAPPATGSSSASPLPPASAPSPTTSVSSSSSAAPSRPLAGQVVVLDPGHNRDNGRYPDEIGRSVDAGGFSKACNTTGTATDGGVAESTVNWELALLVRDRLTDLGARVVLTRDADAGWGPCIDERAGVADRAGADLLLSLHADGADPSGRGFHVIAPGLRPGWTDDTVEEDRKSVA